MGTQIRALKFTADDASARRCHLPVDSAKGFGEAIAWQGGTAYLVRKADLRKLTPEGRDALREFIETESFYVKPGLLPGSNMTPAR